MTENTESPSTYMLVATPDSMAEAARGLLRRSRNTVFGQLNAEDRSQLEDEVGYFFDKAAEIVLNWISTGRVDDIERLSGAWSEASVSGADEPFFMEDAPLNSQITARLGGLMHTMKVLLRSNSVARYMGQLSGQRRRTWREALAAIYETGLPVCVNDISRRVASLSNAGTANNALKRLAEIGLLETEESHTGRNLYHLTWPGRMVARSMGARYRQAVSTYSRRSEMMSHGPRGLGEVGMEVVLDDALAPSESPEERCLLMTG